MKVEDATILVAIKASEGANKNQTTTNNGSGSSASTQVAGEFALPIPAAYTLVTAGWTYSDDSLHGAIEFGVGGIK